MQKIAEGFSVYSERPGPEDAQILACAREVLEIGACNPDEEALASWRGGKRGVGGGGVWGS